MLKFLLAALFTFFFFSFSAHAQLNTCLPPTPQATKVTCDTAGIYWPVSAGVRMYDVTLRLASSTSGTTLSAQRPPVKFPVVADQEYVVSVTYICPTTNQKITAETRFKASWCSTTPTCPPLTVRPMGVTCSTAVIGWAPVAGVTQYQIRYQKPNSTPTTKTVSGAIDTLRLDASSTYTVSVGYLCNGQTVNTDITITTPACPAPCPPLNIMAQKITCDTAGLVWTPVPGVRQYAVQYKLSSATTGQTVNVPAPPARLPVAQNADYTATVTYICPGTNQPVVSQVTFKTNWCTTTTQCAPITVRTLQVRCTSAVIAWNQVLGITNYDVTVTNDSTTTSSTHGRTVTLDTLQLLPNSPYTVTVSYKCGEQIIKGKISFRTPQCPNACPIPQVMVQKITCDTAGVFWGTIPGISRYTVSWRQTNTTVDAGSIDVRTPPARIPVNVNSEYIAKVSYVCPGTNQVVSGEYTFKTSWCSTNTCSTVRVQVINLTCDRAIIGWGPIPGATNYDVVLSKDSTLITRHNVTRPTDTLQLTPNTNYNITVSYMCNGRPTPTTIQVKSPDCTVPCPKLNATVTKVNCDSVLITWAPVQGVTNYLVVTSAPGVASQTARATRPSLKIKVTRNKDYRSVITYVCPGTNQRIDTEVLYNTNCNDSTQCAPLTIRPLGITCNRAVIGWNQVPGVTMYDVQMVGDSMQVPLNHRVPRPIDTLVVGPNRSYTVTVSYMCNGQMFPTKYTFTTPACTTNCPTLQTRATKVACDTASIYWSPVPGVTAYVITYSAPNVPTQTATASVPPRKIVVRRDLDYTATISYLCPGTNQKIDTQLSFNTRWCQDSVVCNPITATSTVVNCSTAVVIWTPMPGATGYQVIATKDSTTAPIMHNLPATARMDTLRLMPNSAYNVTVSYMCNGRPVPATIFVKTPECPPAPCPAPMNVRAQKVTCDTAAIVWDAVPGVRVYNVSYQAIGSTTIETRRGVTSPTKIPVAVNSGYTVTVSYLCAGTNQPVNATITFKTDWCTPPPCEPIRPTVGRVECKFALIAWNPIPNAADYQVTISEDSTNNVVTHTTTMPFDSIALNPSSSYTVRISYMCDRQLIEAVIPIQTPACPVNCPQLMVQANKITCDTAGIFWAPVPGVNDYTVSVVDVTNNTTNSVTTPTSPAAVPVTIGHEYRATVTYTCPGTSKPIVTEVTFTANWCPPPCEQLRLSPSGVTCSTARVNWQPLPNVGTYYVSYRKSNETTSTNLTVNSNSVDLRLSENTTYTVAVSYDCNGQRIISEVSVTTTACTPPPTCAPLDLRADKINCNSITMGWTAVPGVTEYFISYNVVGDSVANNMVASTNGAVLEVREQSSYVIEVTYMCNGVKVVSTLRVQTPPCGVKLSETVASNMSVYPNPTTGVLNLRTSVAGSIAITDMNGRTLQTVSVSETMLNQAITVDLQGLSAGIYLVKHNSGMVTKVILK